jgi:copper resistance protein D
MTAAAAAVRFCHLAAAVQLVGAFVFLLAVARPAFRSAGAARSPAAERADRQTLALAGWALTAVAVTGFVALLLQAAAATGAGIATVSTGDLGRLLTGTRFGHVWLLRFGALLLLGGFLALREGEADARDWWALRLEGALLAGVGLGALAWAGHAAAAEGLESWSLTADALHLLATGAWLGGLVPLALLLQWARDAADPEAATVAREATRRFSTLALVAVSALILTGLVNLWIHVRDVAPLVGTPYGRLVLLKLGVFLPLLAVAAVNLTRLKPRLVAARSASAARADLGRLRRNVLVEAVLGLTILAIVGGLGVTPPARHVQPTWPFDFRLDYEVTKGLPGVRTRVAIGSQVAMFGLVAALLAAISRMRRWGLIAVAGLAAIAAGAAVALPPLSVDAYPTTYVRPTVPYTAISITRGLEHYRMHCVLCHGPAGYGDGPAGAGLPKRPADLTAKHTADHTVGDLYWWLTHGIPAGGMPGFADRLSDEDRWDLVNFLRTLATAEQARLLGGTATPTASLVAPDFNYTTGLGEGRSLKDLRGRSIVLLVLFRLPGSLPRLGQLQDIYPALRRAGGEILAIPVGSQGDIFRALGGRPLLFPVVVEGGAEAAATYALFSRDLGPGGAPPRPADVGHLELLIDRQGYLRARGGSDPARLMAEVERLAREAPRAPAPDEHVH